jgi:hypothetical protein
MVYTLRLGRSAARHGGSTPLPGTIYLWVRLTVKKLNCILEPEVLKFRSERAEVKFVFCNNYKI